MPGAASLEMLIAAAGSLAHGAVSSPTPDLSGDNLTLLGVTFIAPVWLPPDGSAPAAISVHVALRTGYATVAAAASKGFLSTAVGAWTARAQAQALYRPGLIRAPLSHMPIWMTLSGSGSHTLLGTASAVAVLSSPTSDFAKGSMVHPSVSDSALHLSAVSEEHGGQALKVRVPKAMACYVGVVGLRSGGWSAVRVRCRLVHGSFYTYRSYTAIRHIQTPHHHNHR